MTEKNSVFVSYARADEHFATDLVGRLTKEPDLAVWQDRICMAAGDYEDQLKQGIDSAEYLVLVMTPAALRSRWVEQEWRRARANGVCICPIKPDLTPEAELELSTLRAQLPAWMDKVQTFDFDRYWKRFVQVLLAPCRATRTPFMPRDLPPTSIARETLLSRVVAGVLSNANPSGNIVVLHGFGGFGKTTLALAASHDANVIAACDGGVLWVTLGTAPSLVNEIGKIYAAFTGQRPEFKDEDDARVELAKVLAGKRCLMVIDDVWSFEDVEPFLATGTQCSRVITTRRFGDVAGRVRQHAGSTLEVDVTPMSLAEAEQLLAAGLTGATEAGQALIADLASKLDRVPLLLRLVNSALQEKVRLGLTLDAALPWAHQQYARHRTQGFDDREGAIGSTIAVSLQFLELKGISRCHALGIFPDDTDIPFPVLGLVWGTDDHETQTFAQTLHDLALLTIDLPARGIRLHDMLASFYAKALPKSEHMNLHGILADAWREPQRLARGYAVRHVVYHVVEAMQDPARVVERGNQLVTLLTDSRFRAHQTQSGDPVDLDRHLARALDSAAKSSVSGAASLAACMAMLKLAYSTQQRVPEEIFGAASEGKLVEAEARLQLFDADKHWKTLAHLLIAWLAPPAQAEPARQLIERTAPDCGAGPLGAALAWVRRPAASGLSAASGSGGPALGYIEKILQRAGGAEGIEGLEPLDFEAIQSGGDASGFIAEKDGPLLVDFARMDPQCNTRYLDRYVEIHASNRYVHYRNRSLWALLTPVLTFHDGAWLKRVLRNIVVAALSPSSMHFEEFLGSSLTGLEARGGATAARALLDREVEALRRANHATQPDSAQTDPWSFHQRRACALAETFALALGDPLTSGELLELARGLPKGLAGLRTLSALTLAESTLIAFPEDERAVEAALTSARAASHRVQDPVFCIHTTAIVNAICERWAKPPRDLEATIEQFVKNPGDERFCSLHRVHDDFLYRTHEHRHQAQPIPDYIKHAATLSEIAAAFEYDDAELLAVNTWIWNGNPSHVPLSAGDYVGIPDPAFAPVLACRLSAFALASKALSYERRCHLIQMLLPVTLPNRTALDTLLARLLLAAAAPGGPGLAPAVMQTARATGIAMPGAQL